MKLEMNNKSECSLRTKFHNSTVCLMFDAVLRHGFEKFIKQFDNKYVIKEDKLFYVDEVIFKGYHNTHLIMYPVKLYEFRRTKKCIYYSIGEVDYKNKNISNCSFVDDIYHIQYGFIIVKNNDNIK